MSNKINGMYVDIFYPHDIILNPPSPIPYIYDDVFHLQTFFDVDRKGWK